MFTPPGYRKRLRSDVERWAGAGLISRSAADTIIAEYKSDSAHAVMTALAFVFAILAAGGLIALVAANWQQIPREVRVAGLLSGNIAILAACLYFALKRETGSIAVETTAALSVVSAAASISLIGQIYHFPSNWPGFALAMMAVAGATALIARSTACLWLAAIAQLAYHAANISETPGGFFGSYGNALAGWRQQDWIFAGFSAVLIGLATSRWTARSGPWTIFIAILPLFWWLDSRAILFNPGRSLVLAACAIVVATILARELRVSERYEAAVSALLGLFAIGVAVLAYQGVGLTYGTRGLGLGIPAWQGQTAIAAAAVLAIAAVARSYPDRTALHWLAAAIAAPFLANLVLPAQTYQQTMPPLSGFVRLAVMVLLPLALLAVEARISDRHKTFAFAIMAMIAIVLHQLWTTKDLLNLSWVLLGGSVALGAALLARRTFQARPREPISQRAE